MTYTREQAQKAVNTTIHVHSPAPITSFFRVLRKGCRVFEPELYTSGKAAMIGGCDTCGSGFKIIRQQTFEWYDHLDVVVAIVRDPSVFKEKTNE